MTTKPTTTATARRTAKNNMFLIRNNFARESRYFVHFFAIVAPLRHWKLPNFTSPLYGVGKQNTKAVAFFF